MVVEELDADTADTGSDAAWLQQVPKQVQLDNDVVMDQGD